jgi:hypothetical protein
MGAPGDILPSPCTSVEGVRCLAGAPGNILPAAKILVRPYGLYSSYLFYTVGVYQDRPQAVSPGKPAMHSHSTGNGMSDDVFSAASEFITY